MAVGLQGGVGWTASLGTGERGGLRPENSALMLQLRIAQGTLTAPQVKGMEGGRALSSDLY